MSDKCDTYEPILDKMMESNTAWLAENGFIADPKLLNPSSDTRRCIALVAQGDMYLHHALKTLLLELHDKCPHTHYISPKMHHTFMIIRGWRHELYSDAEIKQDTYTEWPALVNDIQTMLPSYKVTFDRAVPVKTGIVLCGKPSIDVNSVRELLREKGYVQGEPYNLDICHMSLLRWTSELPRPIQDSILHWIVGIPCTPYITLQVHTLDLIHATWTMYDEDVDVLCSIPLHQ